MCCAGGGGQGARGALGGRHVEFGSFGGRFGVGRRSDFLVGVYFGDCEGSLNTMDRLLRTYSIVLWGILFIYQEWKSAVTIKSNFIANSRNFIFGEPDEVSTFDHNNICRGGG